MFVVQPIGTCLHLSDPVSSNSERPVYPSERCGKWPQTRYEGGYTELSKHNLIVVSNSPMDSIPFPREWISLGPWVCGDYSLSTILQYQFSIPDPISAAGLSLKQSFKKPQSHMSDDRSSWQAIYLILFIGSTIYLDRAHPGCQQLGLHRVFPGILSTQSMVWMLDFFCSCVKSTFSTLLSLLLSSIRLLLLSIRLFFLPLRLLFHKSSRLRRFFLLNQQSRVNSRTSSSHERMWAIWLFIVSRCDKLFRYLAQSWEICSSWIHRVYLFLALNYLWNIWNIVNCFEYWEIQTSCRRKSRFDLRSEWHSRY